MGTAGKMYNTHSLPVASIDHISTGILFSSPGQGFYRAANSTAFMELAVLYFCLNLQSGVLMD